MAKRKSIRSVRQRFDARGVFVFVATPFKFGKNRQGLYQPNLDGMAGNASHFSQIEGDRTLVICGGSGEFGSLSSAEVVSLAEAAVTGVEGRCNVVVGIGGPDRNAVDWVRTGVHLTGGSLPIVTGGGENMVPYYYLAGSVGFTTGLANISLPKSILLHNAARFGG